MTYENTQKAKTGIDRIIHAAGISYKGFRSSLKEKAFKQEVFLACVMLPASFFVGKTWVETSLLAVVVFMVLIAEVINSAIEAVVDRIGPERHELSGAAKDMGSAAVALALVICSAVWATALFQLI